MSAEIEFTKDAVEGKIISIWANVSVTVNKILKAHEVFKFQFFEENINPKIEDIVFQLAVVDSVLDTYLGSDLLEFEETNNALNSKQCIVHIRILAKALKSKDEVEYKRAIELLNNQRLH